MMLAELVKAVLLGFVEGMTEFLPVSSTGHLLVASKFLGLSGGKAFRDSFSIAVQFGAVLAVLAVLVFTDAGLLKGENYPFFSCLSFLRGFWGFSLGTL